MQHLQPNTTLQGGKYRIERVLGQGGFGITYLAEQVSLGRRVAIKEFFMKDFCGRDERTKMVSAPTTGSNRLVDQYRKKFTKEARNLAKLNHPNIINVIDVFEENGTVYYAMPYLSGGSLDDYVRLHGALDESEAMKYVKQIARALKYMHEEHHICHYDVKPANILLDDKGNAVLIDFGISKNYDASGHETSTTPIGLSEGYAPIEQYQQSVEEFSPASDVYALGATLYFLLHGKRPTSAILRASGTPLMMNTNLSQLVKNIINASMKVSKSERTNSFDMFFKASLSKREVSSKGISESTLDKIMPVLIFVGFIAGIAIWIYSINDEPQKYDFRLQEWPSVNWFKALVDGLMVWFSGLILVPVFGILLILFVDSIIKPNRLIGKLLLLLGVLLVIILLYLVSNDVSINVLLLLLLIFLPSVLITIGIKKL